MQRQQLCPRALPFCPRHRDLLQTPRPGAGDSGSPCSVLAGLQVQLSCSENQTPSVRSESANSPFSLHSPRSQQTTSQGSWCQLGAPRLFWTCRLLATWGAQVAQHSH